MESKQTATEWLYEQLTSTWFDKTSGQHILEQAKEMEKEQKAENWQLGYDACEFHNDYENLQTKPINNPYK
jgi:hypothetical protein